MPVTTRRSAKSSMIIDPNSEEIEPISAADFDEDLRPPTSRPKQPRTRKRSPVQLQDASRRLNMLKQKAAARRRSPSPESDSDDSEDFLPARPITSRPSGDRASPPYTPLYPNGLRGDGVKTVRFLDAARLVVPTANPSLAAPAANAVSSTAVALASGPARPAVTVERVNREKVVTTMQAPPGSIIVSEENARALCNELENGVKRHAELTLQLLDNLKELPLATRVAQVAQLVRRNEERRPANNNDDNPVAKRPRI